MEITYKMKCCNCGKEMIYIKDKEIEEMGWVKMNCPNGCDGGYYVPKKNPNLRIEYKKN